MVTPERWREVERLLHAALERAPGERAALLDRECAGDAALRAEVESLLASERPAEEFLATNAAADAAAFLGGSESGPLAGRGFGRYAIEKQIGSGGMGEVYLAYDARLGRRVALKLLSPRLLDDSEPRARFLREARLASALDHPNV